jgi:hypothetical protein
VVSEGVITGSTKPDLIREAQGPKAV